MSELKIKYKDDNEFKCVRRISCKLGLSMPDSDDDILNLSQFRRIDRAITAEFESMRLLTAIATKHAARADELSESLECICSYLSEDGLITTGLAKEIVNAQRILDKSRIEAEKGDGICN